MQLNSDVSAINKQNVNNNITQTQVNDKTSLNPNSVSEKIYGEVKNLTRNEITVITSDGQNLTAKILNPELIKIGMSGEFKITQTNTGEIALNLISSSRQAMAESILNETLASLGLKINNENKDIINMLLNNSYPITKENFQKLNQAIKIVGSDRKENAIFFLNNNIQPSFKGAETLNSYVNQEIKISNQISQLADTILNENNSDFLQKAVSILSTNGNNAEIINNIENMPVLKSNILDLINTNLKFMDSGENSGINSEVVGNTALSENQNQQELDVVNSEIKSDISSFLSQNSKEVFKIIENLVNSNQLDRLDSELRNLFTMSKNVEGFNLKDALGEFFKTFPEFEKPITSLIQTKEGIKEFITKALCVADKDIEVKNFEKHLNTVYEKINTLKNEMSSYEATPSMNQSLKLADNINNNLNFFSSMQNTIFLQIPLLINNSPTTAELYVFKDKNKKPKKAGQYSALVALDTAFLGRFETYIQKNNASISCQFRLESEDIKKIVSENINLLNDYLKNYNLSLDNVSYKKVEEAFTVTSPEPIEEKSIIKDFTFDMQT